MDIKNRIEPKFNISNDEEKKYPDSVNANLTAKIDEYSHRIYDPESTTPKKNIASLVIFSLVISFLSGALCTVNSIRKDLGDADFGKLPNIFDVIYFIFSEGHFLLSRIFVQSIVSSFILIAISSLISLLFYILIKIISVNNSKNKSYKLFSYLLIIFSIITVFGSFLGKSNQLFSASYRDSLPTKIESTSTTVSAKTFDQPFQSQDFYTISDTVLRLEDEAKRKPRSPFVENIVSYQLVKKALESEFFEKTKGKDVLHIQRDKDFFKKYENEVKLKISFYDSKISEYSRLVKEAGENVYKYMLSKEMQEIISSDCRKLGVDLDLVFSQVAQLDAPVEREVGRLSYLVFGKTLAWYRESFRKSEDFYGNAKAGTEIFFDSLIGLGGKNILGKKEVCLSYYKNNINDPKKKSFIHKHPEVFEALKKIR